MRQSTMVCVDVSEVRSRKWFLFLEELGGTDG